MLVKLRNLTLDTESVSALFVDEEKKQPSFHVYVGDRHWEVDQDEFGALMAHLKPIELMVISRDRKCGFPADGVTTKDERRSKTISARTGEAV